MTTVQRSNNNNMITKWPKCHKRIFFRLHLTMCQARKGCIFPTQHGVATMLKEFHCQLGHFSLP